MKLQHEIAKRFEKELGKDLVKEIEDNIYLSHESFDSCEQRAAAIMHNAYRTCLNILTRAIIEHREKDHSEDLEAEKIKVESQLSASDIELSTRIWWRA